MGFSRNRPAGVINAFHGFVMKMFKHIHTK